MDFSFDGGFLSACDTASCAGARSSALSQALQESYRPRSLQIDGIAAARYAPVGRWITNERDRCAFSTEHPASGRRTGYKALYLTLTWD
jgi:hypothetical protein